jgi:hypothetical protein
MRLIKVLIPILVCAWLLCACDYIVLPEDLDAPAGAESKGWSALATSVGESADGDLHIDLTIRNETADWSAMQALADKPARLTMADGKTTPCATVFFGTGGHRLAPGFQMQGYIAGTKAEPVLQRIYVECQGAKSAAGSSLAIDYTYVTGEYNYYYPDTNRVNATLEVDLDQVATDVTYPIAEEVAGLIQKPGAEIMAINDVTLILASVERNADGLQFTWQASNPGEYPTYVHVGNPPVIGQDGILYGLYETPDIVSVPIVPAGDKAEWTTKVAVPQEVKGLYIMLSVESKKQRLFTYYAVDISDR